MLTVGLIVQGVIDLLQPSSVRCRTSS